ncbi:hypothetical protein FACS1894139_01410 [Planctomycetales bacterium]|nr:hypothetical protein FACS1894139_01410 [Planctomycetales bacterium]GHV23954.1 hypothetical protein AGMMS49959_18920 [Planctomycetales bacterium]
MAQINIRLDDTVKQQAEEFLANVGLTMSGAISLFLHQVVRRRRIPFAITDDALDDDPLYNPANMAWLKKSIASAKQGRVVVKTMDELEAMARG